MIPLADTGITAPHKLSEVVADRGPCYVGRSTWYCPRAPLHLVAGEPDPELSRLAVRVVGSAYGLRPGWWQVTS